MVGLGWQHMYTLLLGLVMMDQLLYPNSRFCYVYMSIYLLMTLIFVIIFSFVIVGYTHFRTVSNIDNDIYDFFHLCWYEYGGFLK